MTITTIVGQCHSLTIAQLMAVLIIINQTIIAIAETILLHITAHTMVLLIIILMITITIVEVQL